MKWLKRFTNKGDCRRLKLEVAARLEQTNIDFLLCSMLADDEHKLMYAQIGSKLRHWKYQLNR